jgi:hypothetical protein
MGKSVGESLVGGLRTIMRAGISMPKDGSGLVVRKSSLIHVRSSR